MFQSVRPNNSLYVLHKGEHPYLEIGYVSTISTPRQKYSLPPTFNQTREMVVDIVAKVGNETINYNGLPSQLDIADSFTNGESITISDNKEAMNSEILSLKQKSLDVINSVDLHRAFIEEYDKILKDINPEFAEKQAQKDEIDLLKTQMSDMSKSLLELMESNKQLVERLQRV